MRKLIVSNLVTLDGFFEGPKGELDWFNVDEEFFEYAREMLNSVDAIVYGRRTYEQMAEYWPTVADEDSVITHKMNSLEKIVFSKTLSSVEWKHSRLAKKPVREEIRDLKQQPGKDLVIFGSGSIVSELTQAGLIDEYRLVLIPVVLGSGNPLFKNIHPAVNLKLIRSRAYASGNVILYYEPAH
ncbi:MAG TPA: dihydrofolate reductase family protein [Chitinophagaceae bacterium]